MFVYNFSTVFYKVSKYFLLYVASFLLLLHSFVPHQHHIQDPVKPTVESCAHSENNLLGFLGQVFHMDLGSEHLENFKPVKKEGFDFVIPILTPLISIETPRIEIVINENYEIPALISQSDQFHKRELPLRGPPSV